VVGKVLERHHLGGFLSPDLRDVIDYNVHSLHPCGECTSKMPANSGASNAPVTHDIQGRVFVSHCSRVAFSLRSSLALA
jgi:hypothetical protein